MRITVALLTLAWTIPLALGVASAQVGRGQANRDITREANMRFAEMDANRDGAISRREWRGSEQSFRVHDWDGDGTLSREEVRIGARRAARSGDPDPFEGWDREYEYTNWTEAGFQRLDVNRDGRVSRDEFPFARASFNRADHNRDGTLSRAEFLGGEEGEDDDRDDSFANLDYNRDNRVDRAEWHGSRPRFDALDSDKNGFLTPAEFAGNADAPTADLFASVDANRDGNITWAEWHWDKASFDARDINRDGRISRDEINRTGGGPTQTQNAAHKAGFDRGLADGRAAGQQDRQRGWGWNLEGRAELERADFGYNNQMNARVEYQAGYRNGFRQGYREGYDRK